MNFIKNINNVLDVKKSTPDCIVYGDNLSVKNRMANYCLRLVCGKQVKFYLIKYLEVLVPTQTHGKGYTINVCRDVCEGKNIVWGS